MSDANVLMKLAIDLTKARYKLDPSSQAPPQVFAVKDNQVLNTLDLDFDSEFTKTISIAAADVYLKSTGCDASIFTSEAWMATQKNEGDDLLKGPRPSERPDRVEVLLAEVSTADHYIIAMFKMLRDKKGRLTKLDEFQRVDSRLPKEGHSIRSRFDFFAGLDSTKADIAEMEAQGSTKH